MYAWVLVLVMLTPEGWGISAHPALHPDMVSCFDTREQANMEFGEAFGSERVNWQTLCVKVKVKAI